MRLQTISKLAVAFLMATTMSVASAKTKKHAKKTAKARTHHAITQLPQKKSHGRQAAGEYMRAAHKNSRRSVASVSKKSKRHPASVKKHKKVTHKNKKKKSHKARY